METTQSLVQTLNLTCREGLVYTDEVRSLLIPAEAFGTLRKDLIKNIGIERMRAFLFRYGWNLGRQDAEQAPPEPSSSLKEKVSYGPVVHSLKGHVQASLRSLDITEEGSKVTHFYMEGTWKYSYEAVEHVKNFGLSDHPICYTLTGYASGYISKLIGETVIFKETACAGAGAEECQWVGRLVSEWGDAADEQLSYFEELPILQELEHTHQHLIEEKNNLAKVTAVHEMLTEEIVKGNHLDSIVRVMYEQTGIPVLIENSYHEPLAYEGLSQERLKQEMQDTDWSKQSIYKTKAIETKAGTRLVKPVSLQGEIVAYCSFFFEERKLINSQIVSMFIEKLSSVCSLVLLNEKTKFEEAERMKGRFLEEILNKKYDEKKDILKRAGFISLDLSKPYYICVVQYKLPEHNTERELAFHDIVLKETSTYFRNEKVDTLIGQRCSSIIVLITEPEQGEQAVTDLCWALLNKLESIDGQVDFQVGISLKSDNIIQSAEAYKEALTASRIASRNLPVVTFESLGIVGLLANDYHEKELEKLAKSTLGPLYGEGDEKKIELLKTLYVFLLNGGNHEQTSEDIGLSISGLRYRISKITSILQCSLRDAEENFHLLLALKALKFTGKLDA